METHHMLHGSYMKKPADKYGLTIKLCRLCHRRLHDHREGDLELQQNAQRQFEETHSREEFMRIFGKNFLPEEEGENEDNTNRD